MKTRSTFGCVEHLDSNLAVELWTCKHNLGEYGQLSFVTETEYEAKPKDIRSMGCAPVDVLHDLPDCRHATSAKR